MIYLSLVFMTIKHSIETTIFNFFFFNFGALICGAEYKVKEDNLPLKIPIRLIFFQRPSTPVNT